MKAAYWKNRRLVRKYDDTTFRELASSPEINANGKADAVIISNVTAEKKVPRKLLSHDAQVIRLDHHTRLPVKNMYATPATLGNDRLANAVGAFVTFPNHPVLVIDAGTCIKYDFIDDKGRYHGGSISPGLNMRFKALHHYTGSLPLLKQEKKIMLTGTNTKEAMVSGVQAGALAEVNGFIDQYAAKHKSIKFILTGGDHRFFAGNLKKHIFVSPNLTLLGLNEILDHNIN